MAQRIHLHKSTNLLLQIIKDSSASLNMISLSDEKINISLGIIKAASRLFVPLFYLDFNAAFLQLERTKAVEATPKCVYIPMKEWATGE
jgi:hypothetical protein